MKIYDSPLSISPETHILVGDIAYRLREERDAQWKADGNWLDNLSAGWFHCEGWRQYLTGISKEMDAAEESFRVFERGWNREKLQRGTITSL